VRQATGVASGLEIVEKLKQTQGIHRMHSMAMHWEESVPRLIAELGVPKPAIRAWGEVGTVVA
jgi:hypothetical protein